MSTAPVWLSMPLIHCHVSMYQIAGLAIGYNLLPVFTRSVWGTTNTTQSYLTEIKNLAKMSGRDFAVILKDMLSQISESVKQPEHDQAEQPDLKVNLLGASSPEAAIHTVEPCIQGATQSDQPHTLVGSPAYSRTAMSAHDLNPPEVQRVVVEHIVKREEYAAQPFSQNLRSFSGKDTRPNYEPDYDTWRSGVELVISDPSFSKVQKLRKILESLLPPVADVVKHLNTDSSPTEYLQLSDSSYGTVQDGGELYAKFLDTFQNTGEKPSSYLQQLQVALTQTVK